MSRRSMELSGLVFVLSLLTALMSGCAGRAIRFYPSADFAAGSLPEREPEQVRVVLEGQPPACEVRELGTIQYDPAADGILTSRNMVMDGLRERAAEIGAEGIYQIEVGTAALSNLVGATVNEVSGTAIAFVCEDQVVALSSTAE